MVPEILPLPFGPERGDLTPQRRLDPELEPVSHAECTLEIDALLEGTTHVSGIGWRLTTPEGPGKVHRETRRYGRTLIFSELAALRGGLEEARRASCRGLRVVSPNPLLERLLLGPSPPRLRRAGRAAERLAPIVGAFDRVAFEVSPLPEAELRHAVGEALDVGLHAAAERTEHRIAVMEGIVARSREVLLERRDGEWVANGRYRVRLDPLSCECPAWTARWSRAPVAGRRAGRLPCKHLVALAVHEGITVPADLAQLGRRASS